MGLVSTDAVACELSNHMDNAEELHIRKKEC